MANNNSIRNNICFGASLCWFRRNYVTCFSREDYDTLIRTVLDMDSTYCFRINLMRGTFQNLICNLFIWASTPQGNGYWSRMDDEWNRYIETIS